MGRVLKQSTGAGRVRPVALLVLILFMVVSAAPGTARQDRDSHPDPVTLHLKWKHAFQFAGYYAAREQGYYRDEGLAVTINEATADFQALDTVLSGEAQYGVWSSFLMNERLGGGPYVVLAVIFQHSPYIVLSRRDRGIRVPSDLVGRTVMVTPRQGEAEFRAMLLKEGVSLDKVGFMPHTWNIDDLIDGKVDAAIGYITDQPNQMLMRGVEPAILRASDYGIDFYGDCLFTSEDELEQHRERAEAFRRASLKGWEYAMANVDELVDLILTMPGVRERGLTAEHLHYEAEQMQALILSDLVEIGHINPGRWRQMADTYVALGLLEPDYSLDGFIYEPAPPRGFMWLYLLLGGLVGILLVAVASWLWNRQLRQAVVRRTRELAESESRLVQLSNAAWEAIVVHDNGTVLEANDQYFTMFGYERSELMGQDGLVRTTTPASYELIGQIMTANNLGPYKCTGIKKDGQEFPIELRVRMIDYHGRQVRVAAIRDLTDQAKAAADLLQQKTFADDIINSLPGIFYLYDETLRLVRWNAAYETLLGYPVHDVEGKHALDFFPESETGKITEGIKRVFEGEELSLEAQIRAEDGRLLPFLFSGALTELDGRPHLLGVGLDLTEAKQAEVERRRLSAAIEQAAGAVVITDVDGAILYTNPAFEGATGYTQAEVAGRNPRLLKSGAHDEAFYRAMWDTLGRGETWRGRLVNRKKDGTLFTEDAVISPVRDAEGKVVNFVAAKRDVSEEIKLEDQLRQAQKMEAVGQLAGGVAHDFNNLLQVINGCSELLLEDLGEEDESHDRVREIARAGEKAARLVGQLLAFSRRQVLDIKDVDLNTVIADLMKMLPRIIGEHIALTTVPGHDLGIVHADSGQIEQILMNLCLNARDAMPDGGTLTIETENILVDAQYAALNPDCTRGRYILISLTDTGCGMDKEILDNIFEPFYTTKGVGKGTGLGLSTVYGLVKQHQGMINVYSEVGKGTTFKIYLPVAVRSAGSVGDKIKGPVPGGQETILLAEDDPMVLRLVQSVLEGAGYTVLTAMNGEEALEVYAEHAAAIDLALLDVIMPKMGGKAVFTRLSGLRPDLPFLFSSGYSMNAVHTNFILDEGLRLIQKPYLREDLLRRVREAIDAGKKQ